MNNITLNKEHFVCIPHVYIVFHKKKVTMINAGCNYTVIKYRKSISTPINKGGSLLLGRSLLSGGGLLLSGFTSSHKKLTLISGGCYFRGVVTIGTLL